MFPILMSYPVRSRKKEHNDHFQARIGVILLVAIGGASCLELGEQLSIPGMYGLVSSAEAVVGRHAATSDDTVEGRTDEFVELMWKGGQGAADEGRICKCAISSPSGSHGARKFLTAW